MQALQLTVLVSLFVVIFGSSDGDSDSISNISSEKELEKGIGRHSKGFEYYRHYNLEHILKENVQKRNYIRYHAKDSKESKNNEESDASKSIDYNEKLKWIRNKININNEINEKSIVRNSNKDHRSTEDNKIEDSNISDDFKSTENDTNERSRANSKENVSNSNEDDSGKEIEDDSSVDVSKGSSSKSSHKGYKEVRADDKTKSLKNKIVDKDKDANYDDELEKNISNNSEDTHETHQEDKPSKTYKEQNKLFSNRDKSSNSKKYSERKDNDSNNDSKSKEDASVDVDDDLSYEHSNRSVATFLREQRIGQEANEKLKPVHVKSLVEDKHESDETDEKDFDKKAKNISNESKESISSEINEERNKLTTRQDDSIISNENYSKEDRDLSGDSDSNENSNKRRFSFRNLPINVENMKLRKVLNVWNKILHVDRSTASRNIHDINVDRILQESIIKQWREMEVAVKLILIDNYRYAKKTLLNEIIRNENASHRDISRLEEQLLIKHFQLRKDISQTVKLTRARFRIEVAKRNLSKRRILEIEQLYMAKLKEQINKKVINYKQNVATALDEFHLSLKPITDYSTTQTIPTNQPNTEVPFDPVYESTTATNHIISQPTNVNNNTNVPPGHIDIASIPTNHITEIDETSTSGNSTTQTQGEGSHRISSNTKQNSITTNSSKQKSIIITSVNEDIADSKSTQIKERKVNPPADSTSDPSAITNEQVNSESRNAPQVVVDLETVNNNGEQGKLKKLNQSISSTQVKNKSVDSKSTEINELKAHLPVNPILKPFGTANGRANLELPSKPQTAQLNTQPSEIHSLDAETIQQGEVIHSILNSGSNTPNIQITGGSASSAKTENKPTVDHKSFQIKEAQETPLEDAVFINSGTTNGQTNPESAKKSESGQSNAKSAQTNSLASEDALQGTPIPVGTNREVEKAQLPKTDQSIPSIKAENQPTGDVKSSQITEAQETPVEDAVSNTSGTTNGQTNPESARKSKSAKSSAKSPETNLIDTENTPQNELIAATTNDGSETSNLPKTDGSVSSTKTENNPSVDAKTAEINVSKSNRPVDSTSKLSGTTNGQTNPESAKKSESGQSNAKSAQTNSLASENAPQGASIQAGTTSEVEKVQLPKADELIPSIKAENQPTGDVKGSQITEAQETPLEDAVSINSGRTNGQANPESAKKSERGQSNAKPAQTNSLASENAPQDAPIPAGTNSEVEKAQLPKTDESIPSVKTENQPTGDVEGSQITEAQETPLEDAVSINSGTTNGQTNPESAKKSKSAKSSVKSPETNLIDTENTPQNELIAATTNDGSETSNLLKTDGSVSSTKTENNPSDDAKTAEINVSKANRPMDSTSKLSGTTNGQTNPESAKKSESGQSNAKSAQTNSLASENAPQGASIQAGTTSEVEKVQLPKADELIPSIKAENQPTGDVKGSQITEAQETPLEDAVSINSGRTNGQANPESAKKSERGQSNAKPAQTNSLASENAPQGASVQAGTTSEVEQAQLPKADELIPSIKAENQPTGDVKGSQITEAQETPLEDAVSINSGTTNGQTNPESAKKSERGQSNAKPAQTNSLALENAPQGASIQAGTTSEVEKAQLSKTDESIPSIKAEKQPTGDVKGSQITEAEETPLADINGQTNPESVKKSESGQSNAKPARTNSLVSENTPQGASIPEGTTSEVEKAQLSKTDESIPSIKAEKQPTGDVKGSQITEAEETPLADINGQTNPESAKKSQSGQSNAKLPKTNSLASGNTPQDGLIPVITNNVSGISNLPKTEGSVSSTKTDNNPTVDAKTTEINESKGKPPMDSTSKLFETTGGQAYPELVSEPETSQSNSKPAQIKSLASENAPQDGLIPATTNDGSETSNLTKTKSNLETVSQNLKSSSIEREGNDIHRSPEGTTPFELSTTESDYSTVIPSEEILLENAFETSPNNNNIQNTESLGIDFTTKTGNYEISSSSWNSVESITSTTESTTSYVNVNECVNNNGAIINCEALIESSTDKVEEITTNAAVTPEETSTEATKNLWPGIPEVCRKLFLSPTGKILDSVSTADPGISDPERLNLCTSIAQTIIVLNKYNKT